MPVTPITPAQIDEVGKGASSATTGLSPIGHAPTGHEPAAFDPSRGPRLKWLSDAATQGEWWEDTYPEYDEDGGPTIDRIEGVGAMERGEPESIVQCSERNARFIVALVNAYRAGELVPAFAAANPSGGIDDAIALVKREFPGWAYALDECHLDIHAWICPDDGTPSNVYDGWGETMALAIVDAVKNAK